ncbi:MAG: hypothetical protein V1870_01125 [Candidatus Aenigmatarchaeota archaeon]
MDQHREVKFSSITERMIRVGICDTLFGILDNDMNRFLRSGATGYHKSYDDYDTRLLSGLCYQLFGITVNPSSIPNDYGRYCSSGISNDTRILSNISGEDPVYVIRSVIKIKKNLGDWEIGTYGALIKPDSVLYPYVNSTNFFFLRESASKRYDGFSIDGNIVNIPTITANGNIKPGFPASEKYYFRCLSLDEPGMLGKIATRIGNHEASIDSVSQLDLPVVIESNGASVKTQPIGMIIRKISPENFDKLVVDIADIDGVYNPIWLRVHEKACE